jgi:hypothetical protein
MKFLVLQIVCKEVIFVSGLDVFEGFGFIIGRIQ